MEEFSEMVIKLMANAPPPVKARQLYIAELHNKHMDPDVPATSTIPVAFLAAGKRGGDIPVPDSIQPSFDVNKYFKALGRQNLIASINWIRESPDGLYVISNKAGHCIHCDDPDLVVWAINRLLFPERKNR